MLRVIFQRLRLPAKGMPSISLISPARLQCGFDTANVEISTIDDDPPVSPRQNDSLVAPAGVTIPIPVMTTLLIAFSLNLLQNQRGTVSAEREAVTQHCPHTLFARGIRHIIQIAFRVFFPIV